MAISTAIAIYFLIWWVVLFAVLPWGVRAQGADGAPGTDPGAPVMTNLKMKLVWTTAVTSVIFLACWFVYTRRLVTLDDLATLFGLLR
jgi:predicted secreted protein